MQRKYLSNLDSFKSSIIITLFNDIMNSHMNYRNLLRYYDYLKGYLIGSDCAFVKLVTFEDGKKSEIIKIYNNSFSSFYMKIVHCPDDKKITASVISK